MDGSTPLPRRECTDSHWGGCVPPSTTGNWGGGRSTVRALGRGLGSSHSHICVCTPTLSECRHPLVFTWQLPSSPAGGHCPLSPMGKGTKQEFRCLSSALLPQVGPWGRSWALRLLLRPFCRKAHLLQAPSPLQAHGQRRRAGS